MHRRKFLQIAGVGAASPIFNWHALAQGQADRVLIVSDGKLSRPLTVKDYGHVEALVTDVTKLERHGRVAAERRSRRQDLGRRCDTTAPVVPR